jgi:hypothetical protein
MEIIEDADECENIIVNNQTIMNKNTNGENTLSNKILRDKLNTEKSKNGEKETHATSPATKNGFNNENDTNSDENDIIELADTHDDQLKSKLSKYDYVYVSPSRQHEYANGNGYSPAKIGMSRSRESTDSTHMIRSFTTAKTAASPTVTSPSVIRRTSVQPETKTLSSINESMSNHQKSNPEHHHRSSLGSPLQTLWPVLIGLVIMSLFYGSFFSLGTNKKANNDSISDHEKLETQRELLKLQNRNLDIYLKELKAKYPNQSTSFWANIESSCRHSIIRQKDPSIVLLVSDRETKTLATALTVDILDMVLKILKSVGLTKTAQEVTIDPKSDSNLADLIQENNHDKLKLYIDNKLVEWFKSGDKVALVNNIELLPAQTMLLFYTYGDDQDTAKFPGVLILMNLNLEMSLETALRERFNKNGSNKFLTKFTEDYLFKLWSARVNDDQLKPLFTRIANNVVLVNKEANATVEKKTDSDGLV